MANERSSGTAFFSSKDEKPVLAGAHDYFVNNVLPSDIKACIRNIKAPTLYVNNHDETFLLVRSGRGTLTVNGLDYRLKPNTLINLGPFHRYRYLPDDGEVLEIAESRMNSGTYVYLVANPYMKFERFYVPSEPPRAVCRDRERCHERHPHRDRKAVARSTAALLLLYDGPAGHSDRENAAHVFPSDPGVLEGLNTKNSIC